MNPGSTNANKKTMVMDNSIEKEIDILSSMESALTKTLQEQNNVEKIVSDKSLSLDRAFSMEAMALQRLEDAKKDLANAKNQINACKKDHNEALADERSVLNEVKKFNSMLNTQKEKVRNTLRNREERSIQMESDYLMEQTLRLEQSVEQKEIQAAMLKKKSRELNR